VGTKKGVPDGWASQPAFLGDAYSMFQKKEDGAIKVLFQP
jgi:hypothetical protein